jgi:acyl carrier protein
MNKEKINNIFTKFKINDLNENDKIYDLMDSLTIIKLSLEIEKEFNIKLKLTTDLTLKNIHDQII